MAWRQESASQVGLSEPATLDGRAFACADLRYDEFSGRADELVSSRAARVLAVHAEPGSGLELLARWWHEHTSSAGAFVAVDALALPAENLRTHLFGGSGDANAAATLGAFNAARGGTLLIEHADQLPTTLQRDLLHQLCDEPDHVAPRVVLGLAGDFLSLVTQGKLVTRWNALAGVRSIRLAPVRERQAEFDQLLDRANVRVATAYGRHPARAISPRARTALGAYSWPGNLRELTGVVEGFYRTGDPGPVRLAELPAIIRRASRFSHRKLMRAICMVAVALGLVGLVSAEIVSRAVLGLGDPPLVVPDSTIQYRFQPNRTFSRFGRTISYNAFSMRSESFGPIKASPDELRIMVLGDSIINGGAQTDQHELATEILKEQLRQQHTRPVVVGNASAGGWAPDHALAYLRRYGTLESDVFIYVVSSHDSNQYMGETSPAGSADFPTTPPSLAVIEALCRYLPRYVPISGYLLNNAAAEHAAWASAAPPGAAYGEPLPASMGAIRQILEYAQARGARVVVVQHLEQTEVAGDLGPGFFAIRELATSMGIPALDAGDDLRAAEQRGEQPFRDTVHLSAAGQRVLAKALTRAVQLALDKP